MSKEETQTQDQDHPSTKESKTAGQKDQRTKSIALDAEVRAFIDRLLTDFGPRIKRRPKQFKKRVQTLLSRYLPPYRKRRGKPMSPRITEACQLVQAQDVEIAAGNRIRRDWLAIAKKCVPGFDKLRSNKGRSDEIRRLRNGVTQRLARSSASRPQSRKRSK